MIGPLTNHLWQSTVFALAAALFTLVLRRNRAGVRYWVWLAASVKFLVPFSVLMTLGALLPLWPAQPAVAPAAPAAFTVAVDQIAQPFPGTFHVADSPPRRTVDWGPIVFGAWFLLSAAIVVVRMRRWRAIRQAARGSAPLTLPVGTTALDVRSAPGLLEPGVVGIWRPILLLPERIADCLTRDQLETVLVHEQCHIERRDNLTAAVHMAVETVFWFHPFVWWIGARMVAERERACDEAVLDRGLPPRDYADAILNVCRFYVESPLACVAGVTGANLRKRIDDIMISRTGVSLTAGRKVMLCLASAAAIVLPLAIGAVTAPLRAQTASAASASGQTFEVASIKPCDPDAPRPGGRGGGGGPAASPGRLHIQCMSVEQLINVAYITNGERLLNDDPGYVQWPADDGQGAFVRPTERIRGGPGWAHTDKYTIEATAEGTPDRKTMNGPMLRALLEDRFQLKIHRDADEGAAMYALTVAKGGPKVNPWGAEDECTEWDRTQKAPPMKEVIEMIHRGEKPPCGLGVMAGTNGANRTFALNGERMDGVAYWLSSAVGRHVLDKTGLSGKYTLYLEYAPEDSTADPAGPSIFTAVKEQWGLKLDPAKGPRGYIAIDRVERPSAGGSTSTSTSSQLAAPPPAFEVVSIKPCKGDDLPSDGRGVGPRGTAASPGRLHIDCLPLVGKPSLMRQAYAVHATGRLAAVWVDLPIEGGPAWTLSDRFTIEAKAEGTPSADMMRGPMLQALLEEKFQLKTHRETRQIPVYELSVAKGGPKLRPFDGHCTPVDFTKGNLGAQLEAKGSCPIVMADTRVDAPGQTIDDFMKFVLTLMDRPVVDKTGLSGRFDIHLELPPDLANADVPAALAVAVQQQLGLKISPAKGPGDTLVIDHVERPDAGR